MNTLLLILFALAVCTAVRAADWAWQPAVEWRVDHQSNRLLSVTQPQASEAGWLTLDAAVQRATEDVQLSLQPHFELQRFAQDSALNAENESLQVGGKRLWEYSQLTASAQWSRLSTLTSELAETGIVNVNTRQEMRSAQAGWAFSPTPQSQLQTQLGFSDVDYPDGLRLGLVGYRYSTASVGVTHQISSYTSWTVGALGSYVTAPIIEITSRDVGVQLGMVRDLSAAMHLQVSVGVSQTQRSDPFASRTDASQIWNAQLNRVMEQGQWNFSLARTVTPNGRGVLARRDQLSAGLSCRLAAHFTGSLGFSAIRNAERPVGLLAGDNYRYMSAEAGIDRSLTENWILGVRLGGLGAQHDIGNTNVHGWYTALALRWTPVARPIRDRG